MRPIVLTGPESSGKSTLALALAKQLNYPLLEEYARIYLEQHPPPYTLEDVLFMAKEQLKLEQQICIEHHHQCILDTDLTVYRIWLQEKFRLSPTWIEEHIVSGTNKLYLLCDIDIEWTYDPLREHPNIADRQRLFEAYKNLLSQYNLNFHIVSGDESSRLKHALEIISK